MNEREIFRKAPITEALIDLRVEPASEDPLGGVEGFAERVGVNFPIKEERFFGEHHIRFKAGQAPESGDSSFERIGYIFFTKERDRAVQARKDGFTFSKLKPYESWEKLEEEAAEYWRIYQECVAVEKVTRVAVRYINKIKIGHYNNNLKDYIKFGIELPSGIPQKFSELFFRTVIPHEADDMLAIVIGKSEFEGEAMTYLFDIDVFQFTDISPGRGKVWAKLAEVKEFENRIFFNSITENTRELFR